MTQSLQRINLALTVCVYEDVVFPKQVVEAEYYLSLLSVAWPQVLLSKKQGIFSLETSEASSLDEASVPAREIQWPNRMQVEE